MTDSANRLETPSSSSTVLELIHTGRLRPATRRLADVLDERGPLTGEPGDAGTRAVEEGRRERKLIAGDG